MKKCREQDLKFWKAEYVSWRNVVKKAECESSRQYAEYFRDISKRICDKIESRILVAVLVVISIIAQGCYSIHGVGKDLSTWSRPYIENAER